MERIDPHSVAMGSAIRGAIAQAGLSQAQAAEQIGIGLNSLSRRINGAIPFTWPEVVRIATLTGTTPLDLASNAERIAAMKASA